MVNAYITYVTVTGRRNLVQTGAPLQPSGARHAGSRHTGISPGSEGTVYSRLSSELYVHVSLDVIARAVQPHVHINDGRSGG